MTKNKWIQLTVDFFQQSMNKFDALLDEIKDLQQSNPLIHKSSLKLKDKWIQTAKALLYDCLYCTDKSTIRQKLQKLIAESGGYDPMKGDSPSSSLKWIK